MGMQTYDFTDPKKPALIQFTKPLKPMFPAAEIRVRALRGLAEYRALLANIGKDIDMAYFFMDSGYTLQEYDKAFWINEGRDK